ncbi:M48 family metallopeptidase [Stenotrophomonas sp. C3(2023)]|uniref:M48 family metallopeptidase n=1 Tax=Stenotrophomonas sp. C3(2023) TaxID=3080277 RepID=UPI00293C4851|nr:M48 family metallopeptidase [Stenotrophomonas sp. C3(2023)]MDV3468844.1 M48 family metallopeptidase [Stenotrophomonas sp. C3(2023)]
MTILRTALCLSACLLAANASAIDLKGLTSTGLKAGKALTLSDAEIAAAASQGCAYMDSKEQVVPANDPYAQRLARITQGLANEDGMALDFKAYRTDEVNAWAMANGCVRVYTGLMDMATDDEIRGVIGHEIGHVKLGHSKTKMRTALLASAGRDGLAAAGNDNLAQLSQSQLGELAEGFINAQFSQKEESAADEYGYGFMKRHNYDPKALASMFRKLSSEGGLMSSHPGSEARAARIDSMIQRDAR